jgi:hypothetical protein
MQVSTMETRRRDLCRYSDQSADDCTEIAKETLLDTLYTSEFAFTISESKGGRRVRGPAAGGWRPRREPDRPHTIGRAAAPVKARITPLIPARNRRR